MTPQLVSILIPAYNAEPWIEATLQSAVSQSHANLEIIVVDDGSTDNTLSIAKAFALRHSRSIRVASQPNAGAAAARNHAVRLSSGEYLQFLDADDILDPEKISRQWTLSDYGRVPLLSGAWGRFSDDPTVTEWDRSPLLASLSSINFARTYLSANVMMHPAAWLVRRDVALAAGPWDERLSLNDDGEYFFRVVVAAGGVVYCPDARSHYRSGNPSSLSCQHSRRHIESARLALSLISNHALSLSLDLRPAVADAHLKFAYEFYPAAPDLVTDAERVATSLCGGLIKPEGGRIFHLLSPLVGWKFARRLQRLFRRHAVIRDPS
ncbi:MAG: glycosyltransferase family 2 protein [Opitutaceae bacterium]|jgi:glycosyltransferase involved in cell wall biosynthesis